MKNTTYSFNVGRYECMVVADGTFPYEDPASLFFANASKEDLERVLAAEGLHQWSKYISPYPSVFIDTGEQKVLIDTGGGGLAPTTGNLMAQLGAVGVAPEDVDAVILTHAHPDHIGGCLDAAGTLAFPKAKYLISKREWDFWSSDPDLRKMKLDEPIKQFILGFIQNCLKGLEGSVQLFDEGEEIVTGMKVVAAPGHTPGHVGIEVTSGEDRLLCLADTLIHPIHLLRPDWYGLMDWDPDENLRTRRRLISQAAEQKSLVHCYHFPFPGLGYIREVGKEWTWEAI